MKIRRFHASSACLLLVRVIHHTSAQSDSAPSCKFRPELASNDETVCSATSCVWLPALEQNGTETGRCSQCSPQTTQAACEGTGICFWMAGRTQLGGIDCTLCAGRTQADCKATGYCFWTVEDGNEGVCSKCPGYTDEDSCSFAGCFWRDVIGVEKCVKCSGFHLQENCEAAACVWNADANVKCGGNPNNFVLPANVTSRAKDWLRSGRKTLLVVIVASMLMLE